KLANLLLRTASAGVRHDIDGVDDAFFVMGFERFEHTVRDFFCHVAPNGNDLVVALAVGDGAIEVLLLNLDGFLFGVFYELDFITWNNHVIDADGNAGARGVGEAERLQAIKQRNSTFQTETKIGVINELLNALLLEQAIDKRHVRG